MANLTANAYLYSCLMFMLFSDKYQLIGTLMSECSCHSNVNSTAAAAASVTDGGTPGSEGINAAAAAAAAPSSGSSSGICILV